MFDGFDPMLPATRAAGQLARRRPLPLTAAMSEQDRPAIARVAETMDQLLVVIGRDRDRAAFIEVFEHFAPRVKAFMIRQGCDAGQAEELAQETLLTVWRRAESYDPSQAGAATWIYTIARNKRIDALRRDRRPELDPDDPALTPAAEVDAERAAIARQNEGSLRAAIAGLPQEQAALLHLAFFQELSHSEIAEREGLPLGTVKSRLRLAMVRLRKVLEAD